MEIKESTVTAMHGAARQHILYEGFSCRSCRAENEKAAPTEKFSIFMCILVVLCIVAE